MLKYAGWDGIVIEGRADEPVWLDIRNQDAKIVNCSKLSLWGTDTWECRQCVDPDCVNACPVDALSVDGRFGNVRRVVDMEKCIGCGACVEACQFAPSRAIMVLDEKFDGDQKARKCDLCAEAPYHWDYLGGSPAGKQARVEVCPVGAIQFATEVPRQAGDSGYKVNLRDLNWSAIGYSRL